ncbi:hypothetical protein Dred_2012 [Desulforamulus reducens MI-1]|uniref:Uncharacterized protein n=1 Tax=Desulforamulus reducens (strain ATCC BAA-1160 / DSM 100696 / MI-1) TaxID=349161 RepID=A4J626_DESRM|nr:hypothetical protein [Desulforamulus reducens]ABO50529.1 hypothetical protein Dred_2012 [Desulforamulus reducens MI-1]
MKKYKAKKDEEKDNVPVKKSTIRKLFKSIDLYMLCGIMNTIMVGVINCMICGLTLAYTQPVKSPPMWTFCHFALLLFNIFPDIIII